MRNLYKAAQSHPLTLSSSRWQTDKPVSCLFCLTCIQSLRNSPHIQSPHILPCMCWVPLLYLTADIMTHISLIHHSKDSQLFFPGDTRVCPCIHFFSIYPIEDHVVLEPIPAVLGWQGTPWRSWQSVAELTQGLKQPLALIFMPVANIELPLNLTP